MTGALVRRLGSARVDLAEECAQEALARAVRAWPLSGMPADPERWLVRVAWNHATDLLRREAKMAADRPDDVLPDGVVRGETHGDVLPDGVVRLETRLEAEPEDRLLVLFGAAHPSLPPLSRVVLTLKVAMGFGTTEIARALLQDEATVAQRIVRAKRKLADAREAWAMPSPEELPERVDAVLDTLFLAFSEGYARRSGEDALDVVLMDEAIDLAELLLDHVPGRLPQVHALLATMWLQSSRADARVDGDGVPVRLQDQDRSRWDRDRVDRGLWHLGEATAGPPTELHLLAGIAAVHATSPSWEETDWDRIVACYDALVAVAPSPVHRLARAVAVGVRDPRDGLRRLDELDGLDTYAPFWAARAEILERVGRDGAAEWRRAAELAVNEAERKAYLRRLDG